VLDVNFARCATGIPAPLAALKAVWNMSRRTLFSYLRRGVKLFTQNSSGQSLCRDPYFLHLPSGLA
jgi:hypothetical protein